MSQLLEQNLSTHLTGIDFDPAQYPSLRAIRERALADHQAAGIPTRKDEEWKYTDIRYLGDAQFSESATIAPNPDKIAEFLLDEIPQIRIVFVNGRYNEELTTSLKTVPGLEIRHICCGLSDHLEVLEKHIGTLESSRESTFANLNTATFKCGSYVYLAKNTSVEPLIHILHITTSTSANAEYQAPRNFIYCENGSKATILESYIAIDEAEVFSNSVTEVFIEPNANIEHVRLQWGCANTTLIHNANVKQEGNSAYHNYAMMLGGKMTRNDLNVFLNGSNLHSRMDGIVVLDGTEHADNHTRLDHAFPNCDSFEVYKHILDGESVGVFNGKIMVHEDAQKTDAKQTNQALLMSKTATINTKPQLEIFADDVKCTHGATIGHLNALPKFYMQSRGIPKAEAEAILVYAFAAEVLERITCRPLVVALEAFLYKKLRQE